MNSLVNPSNLFLNARQNSWIELILIENIQMTVPFFCLIWPIKINKFWWMTVVSIQTFSFAVLSICKYISHKRMGKSLDERTIGQMRWLASRNWSWWMYGKFLTYSVRFPIVLISSSTTRLYMIVLVTFRQPHWIWWKPICL